MYNNYEFTTENCCTFGTALNREQVIAQLTSGEHLRACIRVKGGHFEQLL